MAPPGFCFGDETGSHCRLLCCLLSLAPCVIPRVQSVVLNLSCFFGTPTILCCVLSSILPTLRVSPWLLCCSFFFSASWAFLPGPKQKEQMELERPPELPGWLRKPSLLPPDLPSCGSPFYQICSILTPLVGQVHGGQAGPVASAPTATENLSTASLQCSSHPNRAACMD